MTVSEMLLSVLHAQFDTTKALAMKAQVRPDRLQDFRNGEGWLDHMEFSRVCGVLNLELTFNAEATNTIHVPSTN